MHGTQPPTTNHQPPTDIAPISLRLANTTQCSIPTRFNLFPSLDDIRIKSPMARCGADTSTVGVDPTLHYVLCDIIWSYIGSYLPPHDIFHLALTCKRFGKKVAEIDRWMLSYDKPELTIMEYVANDLVLGHVDWWISATFSPFLIYYTCITTSASIVLCGNTFMTCHSVETINTTIAMTLNVNICFLARNAHRGTVTVIKYSVKSQNMILK